MLKMWVFLPQICEHRDIDPKNAFVKIGVDSGQKTLKIVLQVCDTSAPPSARQDSLNGVNKLHIIGAALDVPECDEAFREIWRLLDIDGALPEDTLNHRNNHTYYSFASRRTRSGLPQDTPNHQTNHT